VRVDATGAAGRESRGTTFRGGGFSHGGLVSGCRDGRCLLAQIDGAIVGSELVIELRQRLKQEAQQRLPLGEAVLFDGDRRELGIVLHTRHAALELFRMRYGEEAAATATQDETRARWG